MQHNCGEVQSPTPAHHDQGSTGAAAGDHEHQDEAQQLAYMVEELSLLDTSINKESARLQRIIMAIEVAKEEGAPVEDLHKMKEARV